MIETANNIPMEETEPLVDDETDVMAPQIMVNEDGEIVINQDRLYILFFSMCLLFEMKFHLKEIFCLV